MEELNINLEYPKIKNVKKNLVYAQALQNSYGGPNSELSSFAFYLYHSFYMYEYPDICEALKHFSNMEAFHLRMFGEMITAFGGEPYFLGITQNNAIFWNGNMINYSKSLRDIIAYNIQMKEDMIFRYKKDADNIKEESVSDLINRIAKDEELQLDTFKGFYNTYC